MNELVVFDLDNTLIKGQSLKLFLTYSWKNNLIGFFSYLKILFWFLLYKMGLVRNPQRIMEYGFSFLKGKNVGEIKRIIKEYFEKDLKRHIYKDAVKILQEHKEKGRKIIIVSNSIELILEEIARFLGIDYFIGTKLETEKEKFTGRIKNGIIYGEKKVEFVRNIIKKMEFSFDRSWAYTDHDSDMSLLKSVRYPFAVNPTKKLRNEALTKKWPILIFKENMIK